MRYTRPERQEPIQKLGTIEPKRYQPGRYGVKANVIQLGGGYNRPSYYGLGRGRTMPLGPIAKVLGRGYQEHLRARQDQQRANESEEQAMIAAQAYEMEQAAKDKQRAQTIDEGDAAYERAWEVNRPQALAEAQAMIRRGVPPYLVDMEVRKKYLPPRGGYAR